MTTRPPGLTAAMRRALERFSIGCVDTDAMFRRAFDAGFCDYRTYLTSRGHAALAAPRMTAAELAMLEAIEDGGAFSDDKEFSRPAKSIRKRGFVTPINPGEYILTPAGLAALNNMRAAMGSAEWKP